MCVGSILIDELFIKSGLRGMPEVYIDKMIYLRRKKSLISRPRVMFYVLSCP